jgi:hypothetical protein
MKKTVFCLILGCSLIFLAQNAFAVKCYQFTLFTDVVKVLSGTKVINGVWYASPDYYMPFVGTIVIDSDPDFNRFSIHVTNNTTAFGGFRDCVVDATLSKTKPIQGTAIIDCGVGGFSLTTPFAQVDCKTVSPFDTPLPLLEPSLPIGFSK